MTNIANMSATLTLSAWEFQNGLTQSYKDLETFEQKVESVGQKTNRALASVGSGGMSGGGARALQQVGFMIQDFSSQIDTRGLTGAFGAISNNLQMLGAGLGPTGMAVSAVGGALAGILIPKLLEASGMFHDGRKAADEYGKKLDEVRSKVERGWKLEQDALKGGVKSHADNIKDRESEMKMLQKQTDAALKEQQAKQQAANDARGLRDSLNQKGGIFNWWEANQIDTASPQAKADEALKRYEALQKEMSEKAGELGKLKGMTPEVAQAEAAREQKERQKQAEREEVERRIKGEQEIERFKSNALERYGTAQEKLDSKHAREFDEMVKKTEGLGDQDKILAQMKDAQAADRARSSIDEKERELAKLGKDNGMSAGVDLNSADGIRAINQAISGQGENSYIKEQLELERKQLAELEQIARGGKEGEAAAARMKAPELGQVEALGYADDSNGGRWKREVAPPSISSEATLGRAEPLGSMDREDPVRKAVEAKRANDSASAAQFKERMKVALEHKRLLEEIARKPVSKVVALSG